MSASLKPVLGRQIRGMRQLESKILDLQKQYQSLIKEREESITTIIATLDLASLEDSLIVGGLLFIKEKVLEKDPILEAWRDAGEKFLRRSKPQSRPRKDGQQVGNYSRSREHEGGKQDESFPYPHKQNGTEQAGTPPRIPSGENTSSKQNPSPQATHQPPQKQPQSREK